jgi:hypothetical protein
MKKLITLALVIVAGVYLAGWLKLSMSGSARFIDTLDELLIQGKSDELCDRMHADLRVSVEDRTGPQPVEIVGGKDEYCDYVSMAAKGMGLLGVSMHTVRHDYTVERSWRHPWTAHVRYHEERTTTMSLVNQTVRSESDDHLTLVYTFAGVKLLGLEARSRLASD